MDVIGTNPPIDLSDIADANGDVLSIAPTKEQIREQKAAAKEQARELARAKKELEKENKKTVKEQQKIKEEAGVNCGENGQKARAYIVRARNNKRFGEFLKSSGFKLDDKLLNKLSDEDLVSLQERISFAISNKNSENMLRGAILTGIFKAEHIAVTNTIYPLKVQGLTATLNSDESFHDVLEEIILENQCMVYTNPIWRLAYMVGKVAVTLHSVNSELETVTPEQKQQLINKAIEEKNKVSNQTKDTRQAVESEEESFSDKMNKLRAQFGDLVNN